MTQDSTSKSSNRSINPRTNLQGQVICITGAGRGLGRALAEAFAKQGASLVLGARTASEIDALAAQLGDGPNGVPVIALQTNVQNVGEIRNLVTAAVGEFGKIDVMINNAGVAHYGPIEDVNEAQFDEMMATNVKGTYFGSQAALNAMKPQRSGLIVNVSSIAGKLHLPGESAYNASKWAVNGFTGTLRLEAQKYGVRVTCLCPGGIHTPFWRHQETVPYPTDLIEPERDFMDPNEVANSVVEIAMTSERYVVPEIVMMPVLTQL